MDELLAELSQVLPEHFPANLSKFLRCGQTLVPATPIRRADHNQAVKALGNGLRQRRERRALRPDEHIAFIIERRRCGEGVSRDVGAANYPKDRLSVAGGYEHFRVPAEPWLVQALDRRAGCNHVVTKVLIRRLPRVVVNPNRCELHAARGASGSELLLLGRLIRRAFEVFLKEAGAKQRFIRMART